MHRATMRLAALAALLAAFTMLPPAATGDQITVTKIGGAPAGKVRVEVVYAPSVVGSPCWGWLGGGGYCQIDEQIAQLHIDPAAELISYATSHEPYAIDGGFCFWDVQLDVAISASLILDLVAEAAYNFSSTYGIYVYYPNPTPPPYDCLQCFDYSQTSLCFLSSTPAGVIRVCSASTLQTPAAIVSDGEQGGIVTWYDGRSGTSYDIYAQRVLAGGKVDPSWPTDGRALCTAASDQLYPRIASDEAGGAIVTWMDYRNGNSDIYVQHVLASGAVDPVWPTDGLAICNCADIQGTPTIVSDGAGGAIVTWHDHRDGDYDMYAQHVMASGVADPAWPADGRAFCTATGDQVWAEPVSDGMGGVVVAWTDSRNGNWDLYAQHVLASGEVDPAWPADGRAICTAAEAQDYLVVDSDGAGGAVATWRDSRSGSWDIYAHHVLASGEVDPAWPADGRALCTAANSQESPAIASDGAGGAIVSWMDERSLSWDIYAQHVLASGEVDPAWPAQGRAVCTATNNQVYSAIVSDDAGGAIVAWEDLRSGGWDVYGQHVLSSGENDPECPTNGRLLSRGVCTGESAQVPRITHDGMGGAVVAWGGTLPCTDGNIFAALMRGPTPTDVLVALVSADATSDGVRLEWSLGSAAGFSATVYRRTDQSGWTSMGEISSDGTGRVVFVDHQVSSRTRYGYRLGLTVDGVETFAGETWVEVPAAVVFALHGPQPNPNAGALNVSFSLAAARPATLELLDVSGRRLVSRQVGSLGVGTHVVELVPGSPLVAGIYLVRLTQNGRSLTAKAAIVK